MKKVSSMLELTPYRETLVDVAITYAGFTRFNGTPFTAYGPVTKRLPDLRDFNTTTLLPLCFPESKITMFPGWIEALPVDGRG